MNTHSKLAWWQNQGPAVRALHLESLIDKTTLPRTDKQIMQGLNSWDIAVFNFKEWYILTYAAAPDKIKQQIDEEFDIYCSEQLLYPIEDFDKLSTIMHEWFMDTYAIFWHERMAPYYEKE